jgi:hypothetical protein
MDYTKTIPIPKGINPGIRPLNQRFMLSSFGPPRPVATVNCSPVTSESLKKDIVTQSVGPFRVTGHKLAVADLVTIYADVKAQYPELYAQLGCAGMLCARKVRGGQSWSNHSFGFAVDHYIDKVLDARGDNRVQQGMALMAPIFNSYGWFWGAGFGTEDAMHMEMGLERLIELLKVKPSVVVKRNIIAVGDRGPEVLEIQKLLVKAGFKISADGQFGPGTKHAVENFQAAHQLDPDGAVGALTFAALRDVA